MNTETIVLEETQVKVLEQTSSTLVSTEIAQVSVYDTKTIEPLENTVINFLVKDLLESHPLYSFSKVHQLEYLGEFTAGENIIEGSVLTIGEDGKLYKADSNNLSHANKVLGVAYSNAIAGDLISFIIPTVVEGTFGFLPGKTVYLGANGQFTQDPHMGYYQQELGIALSSSKVLFNRGLCIIR